MIAFPRRGLTMSKTGDIVTIKMTDDPDSSDFEYMAHRRGDTQKDVFYIGAYLGSVISNKLRSLSEQRSSYSEGETLYRTYARNNTPASNGNGGSGYDMFGWYQFIFIQCMYVLKYKNLNSQAVIGNGSVSTYKSDEVTTGGTETKGMDWGTTENRTTPMKLFGIEHLWGGCPKVLDGVVSNTDGHICTATENFNNTGEGYIDRGNRDPQNWGWGESWYLKRAGTTHQGFAFLNSTTGGSETTYYCDYGIGAKNSGIICGSYSNDHLGAGIFWFREWIGTEGTSTGYGAVLMYL